MIYLITVLLVLAEILYIKIALAKNIKDTPNHRSAHTTPTIRGGGIIVFISVLLYIIFFPVDKEILFFALALSIVSIVSFVDDLISLSSKFRILCHLSAFTIMFYALDMIQLNGFYLLFTYALSLVFLNIYNFMDGINGITFLNALVTYSTLLFINKNYIVFVDSNLLIVLIIATLVFGFFNFRKKAICFAGDIGSIAIGFSIIYLVIKLYIETNSILVFLVLTVYLLDGGWTIFERLLRKENILIAHKRHLYQLLANDLKWSHLEISFLYFLFQLIVNIVLVFSLVKKWNGWIVFLTMFLLSTFIYFGIKFKVLEKIRKR